MSSRTRIFRRVPFLLCPHRRHPLPMWRTHTDQRTHTKGMLPLRTTPRHPARSITGTVATRSPRDGRRHYSPNAIYYRFRRLHEKRRTATRTGSPAVWGRGRTRTRTQNRYRTRLSRLHGGRRRKGEGGRTRSGGITETKP